MCTLNPQKSIQMCTHVHFKPFKNIQMCVHMCASNPHRPGLLLVTRSPSSCPRCSPASSLKWDGTCATRAPQQLQPPPNQPAHSRAPICQLLRMQPQPHQVCVLPCAHKHHHCCPHSFIQRLCSRRVYIETQLHVVLPGNVVERC